MTESTAPVPTSPVMAAPVPTIPVLAVQEPTRREHDLLGDRDVPAAAYYGVPTLRAVENFPISGVTISIYP